MNQNIIIYLACICLIFLLGRIFIVPIKTISKLIINSVFGGILICLINLVGGVYGFHIGLNIITAVCIGILGVPGAILLIALKFFIRINTSKLTILAIFMFLV
ncbi:MAG: pro-sigmaK processing inhibitor BofA family protein [Clostridia bacterium]|nr:pro-sigmaK processing inhibitor BofA family protein [Clostridia bacterium]